LIDDRHGSAHAFALASFLMLGVVGDHQMDRRQIRPVGLDQISQDATVVRVHGRVAVMQILGMQLAGRVGFHFFEQARRLGMGADCAGAVVGRFVGPDLGQVVIDRRAIGDRP